MGGLTVHRWIRLAFLGLVGLVTWEALARLEDWWSEGAVAWRPYSINTLFRSSSVGREGVPGARFGKWRMNRLGFRGEDPESGREAVLAFGASETFGQYESPGQEYPRQLAKELDARLPGRFDVQNVSLPGMRIGRTAFLRKVLQETRPRFVVIYPSPANYIGIEKPICHQPVAPVPSGASGLDHARIVGKVSQLSKRVVPASLMTALREVDLWWVSRGLDVAPRVKEETIRAFRIDLECAVDETLALGATPVLVTHATYFGDEIRPGDRAWMIAWRRFYPGLAESGFLDLERRANDVVRAVARERGLPLYDAAGTIPAGPAHFADFVHFTDDGARLMARGLAAAIAGAAGS